jgi:hypothetical protein
MTIGEKHVSTYKYNNTRISGMFQSFNDMAVVFGNSSRFYDTKQQSRDNVNSIRVKAFAASLSQPAAFFPFGRLYMRISVQELDRNSNEKL